MKTYFQYFWSDGIGTPALIFAIIGILALIFPDQEPHTTVWGIWVIFMLIVHFGRYIWGVNQYRKNK